MSSAAEDKREQRLKLPDDHIGRSLADSEKSGELRSAPSFGKPLNLGDGYDETPAELRMAMKVLKDAGVVPPEVELMQQLAALRKAAAEATDVVQQQLLLHKASQLEQAIAMRLERLRGGGL